MAERLQNRVAERRKRRKPSTDGCSGRPHSPRSARSANPGADCGAPTDSADDAAPDPDAESLDDHLADTVHHVDLDGSVSAVAVEGVDRPVALAIGREDGR